MFSLDSSSSRSRTPKLRLDLVYCVRILVNFIIYFAQNSVWANDKITRIFWWQRTVRLVLGLAESNRSYIQDLWALLTLFLPHLLLKHIFNNFNGLQYLWREVIFKITQPIMQNHLQYTWQKISHLSSYPFTFLQFICIELCP